MVVHCEFRGEYFDYSDGGPAQTNEPGTCPTLIYGMTAAGQGWAESWEAWLEEHPCP